MYISYHSAVNIARLFIKIYKISVSIIFIDTISCAYSFVKYGKVSQKIPENDMRPHAGACGRAIYIK